MAVVEQAWTGATSGRDVTVGSQRLTCTPVQVTLAAVMSSSSVTSPARADLSVAPQRFAALPVTDGYRFTYFADAETVGATMA